MKKFSIILLLVAGCCLFAGDREYKLIFDYNPLADSVSFYNVFIIELSDTLLTPFEDEGEPDSIRAYQIGSFNEDSLKAIDPDSAIVCFMSAVNDKYLQAAATAVNKYGAENKTAVSGFYDKGKDQPTAVSGMRWGKNK